ncbi:hypothetical protein, partial [Streptomyces sp. NPDC003943]
MTAPDANLPAGEILIVNETYVRQQPVLDQEGRRYLPAASGAKTSQSRPVRVITPPSYASHTKAVINDVDAAPGPSTSPAC